MHDLLQENVVEAEDDPFPESEYVLISRKRLRRKLKKVTDDTLNFERSPNKRLSKYHRQNKINPSAAIIKREPSETTDEEEECIKTRKRKSLLKYHFCKVCGTQCKGVRGLRQHIAYAHKNSRKSSDSSLSDDSDEIHQQHRLNQKALEDLNKRKSTSGNNNNPNLDANNSSFLLNQNSQPGLICDMFSSNNILSVGNQPDLQKCPPAWAEGAKIIEIIPKFDPDSQIYIKWLKKFVQKCTLQKYPLSSITCENINHIIDEIENAMFNPTGSLRVRSTYFYFMKMYKILADIMSGHMRHCLSVVIK